MFAREHVRAGRRRVAAGIGAALVVLVIPVGAAAAPGSAGGAGKGAAAPVPPAAPRVCTLQPSAHTASEWASCLRVDARLDHLPGRGETARLHVEITAEYAEQQVRVEADLPANLAWQQAPAGLARAQVGSAAPQHGGRVDRAGGTVAMAAGKPQAFDGVVQAVGSGPAEIRVSARVDRGGGTVDAAADTVFLTVGEPGKASRAGIAGGTAGGTTLAPAGTVARPATDRPMKPVGSRLLPEPSSDDRSSAGVAADNTCATGNFFYVDNTGVTRPARAFQVQAWDSDTVSDDLLKAGYTDGAGHFNVCFDNDDGIGGGGQDVYLRFVSENDVWQVADDGDPYEFSTGIVNDVATGSVTSFGNRQPTTSGMRGVHAFDEALDLWNGIPGTCWDTDDATCRQVHIDWTPGSTEATRYVLADDTVYLAAADPDSQIVVVHEISHAVMDDVYEDSPPPNPNCISHPITGVTSAGCAWTEGFAEWLPAMVYNDPFFRWPTGAAQNLEDPSWDTLSFARGDQVEGRVAGALIDISDSTNEAFWDRYTEAPMVNIWNQFQSNRANTFAEFWAERTADKSDAGALASVYQNTIDYGFRDPLGSGLLNRPVPTPHSFSLTTTTHFWSLVALRPASGADYDVNMFDDRAQNVLLGRSAVGSSAIDFAAVDSNVGRRPFGDYYPRVEQFRGTGNYQVQYVQGGGATLDPGVPHTLVLGSSNLAGIRDAHIVAGTTATFTVSSASGDAELFVVNSRAADQSTWLRGRTEALGGASSTGPGGTETITLTAPETGWYGVVVVNKSGSGTYTLTRS